MNANRLQRHLNGRLSPAERLALMASAYDRGDRAEVDRLLRDAPAVTYSVADTYPLTNAWFIVSLFQLGVVLDLALQRERLRRAADRRDLGAGSRAKARKAAAMVEYVLMLEVKGYVLLGKESGFDALSLWRDMPQWKHAREVVRLVKGRAMSAAEATAALQEYHPGAKARTARSVLRGLRHCLHLFSDDRHTVGRRSSE